jgi:diamine N-acetyltransferase
MTMNLLESETVRLRALEPEDIDILYRWENDTAVWGVSHTLQPFSRHVLRRFIEDQSREIYQTLQKRLVIERHSDGRPVGVIDLSDFDPLHLRAEIGILIYAPEDRHRGYAAGALHLLIDYAFGVLFLHQLYCRIPASNTVSLRLFEGCGFERSGCQKEWFRTLQGWEDELTYQLLKPADRKQASENPITGSKWADGVFCR